MPKRTLCQKLSTNFDTLRLAFRAGRVAMLECRERSTGNVVALVVGLNREPNGDTSFVPLARMLEGNPYEQYDPADPDGGFHSTDAAQEGAT